MIETDLTIQQSRQVCSEVGYLVDMKLCGYVNSHQKWSCMQLRQQATSLQLTFRHQKRKSPISHYFSTECHVWMD